MNGMLLCAGFGTRFKPLTDKIAKPSIPFFGVPLCGYPLFYLEQLGIKKLVVNTHHLPETVKAAIAKLTEGKKYPVQFSDEQNEILGSGGGIYKARAALSESSDFVVINGDEVFFPTDKNFLKIAVDIHQTNGALATLVTCEHPDAGCAMGAIRVDDNNILELGVRHSKDEFAKLTAAERSSLKHFSGIFIFSSRVFDYMPKHGGEFHIFKDCLAPAMARGEKVKAHHLPTLTWFDMSSQEAYLDSAALALHLLEGNKKQAEVFREILSQKGPAKI